MAEEKFDFDKKAGAWDDNPARVKLANDIAGAMIEEKIFAPDRDVLEFGCGTGLLTVNISPLVRSITGVDGSSGMLSMLEAKIKDRGLANIKTQRVDPSMGGIIEGCYGAVISSMTLHHVKEIGPLFSQFHRVTAPGGYVCLADLDSEEGRFHGENPTVFHNGFERKMVEKTLVDAGFCEVRDKTAATVKRPVAGGAIQTFSIFLITCRKSG